MSENKKEKIPTLEENFSKIEDIIAQMESPEITLEDSFTLYQSGIQTLKSCNGILDEVEKKMQIITEDGTLEDF